MELPDLHIHSTHSDGELAVAGIARLARKRKVTAAIADHVSPYYMLFDEAAFDRYEADVRRHGLLLGAEYCIGETIPVGPERLTRLDFLIGGLHAAGKVGGGNDKIFFWSNVDVADVNGLLEDYMAKIKEAVERDPIDIIAHPTFLPLRLMDRYDEVWTEDRVLELIGPAVEKGVALEINCRWKVPNPRVIEICLRAGASFSAGSDAHRREHLFSLEYAYEMTERFGITEERLFTPVNKTRV